MESAVAIGHDLRGCFESQRSAFRKSPPGYRRRIEALRSLERVLLNHKDDLIASISADFGGRASEETLALELAPALNEIRHALHNLKRWMEPRHAAVGWQFWPARARVMYQPLGVVGILSAWNYPLFLSIGPMIGAIAAGDHVMVKPSELAPQTAELIRSMVAEIYPPEYATVLTGDAAIAAEFARLPFDRLLFTGSERVGRLVMKSASENLTPVTLELGGKSPALIHLDYPLRTAVERILTGKLYNAGQTCVAPDYVLLPADHKDEFLKLSRELVSGMYPQLVANQDYTSIINAKQYQRLASLREDARRRGAQVVEINPSDEKSDEANRVFPPTLLLDVNDDMQIMQEEIFGPLLPIVLYKALDEAIQYINARPHPLALYYFDYNGKRIRRVLDETAAGGVTVNDCMFHVGQPNLPFGGVGPSGMGAYHGFDGFETFSKKKGVLLQSRWTPLSLLRPPYGANAHRILRFIVGK
jgi:coniferyl-aldehyde dehydrogenase